MVKYSEKIDIRGHYTDLEGRLIVKSLCDLFNDVANVQTYALKIDVPTLNEQGLTWMLHKLHILIDRMPEQGEKVTLETWPSGIDRLFAIRDFRMLDGEEVILRATSEWMVIDLNRRRPVRLPACVTETAPFAWTVFGKFLLNWIRKRCRQTSRALVVSRQHTIILISTSMSLKPTYVRWVTNSLSYDFLKDHEITELEIIYEHEVLPDSVVCAGCHVEEAGNRVKVYHQVKNESLDKTHCFAVSYWKKR